MSRSVESRALQVLRVQLAPLALPVVLAQRDRKAHREYKETPEPLGPKEHRGPQVQRVHKGLRVLWGPWVRKVLQELRGPLVRLVLQVYKVRPGLRVQQVSRVLQELRAPRDPRVPRE